MNGGRPPEAGPRCLHPVAWRAKNDPGTGLSAVCWRPLDHPGDRHQSKATFLRERDRRHRYRQQRRQAAVLSEGALRVAA